MSDIHAPRWLLRELAKDPAQTVLLETERGQTMFDTTTACGASFEKDAPVGRPTCGHCLVLIDSAMEKANTKIVHAIEAKHIRACDRKRVFDWPAFSLDSLWVLLEGSQVDLPTCLHCAAILNRDFAAMNTRRERPPPRKRRKRTRRLSSAT